MPLRDQPHEGLLRLRVILTGGTIDKFYDAEGGMLRVGADSVRAYIGSLCLPDTELSFRLPFAVDSLEMTDQQRGALADVVEEATNDQDAVLVTHGTDTMARSMACLASRRSSWAIPIVFTGAMEPLAVSGSDGRQNVAQALLACRMAAAGIYLVFHGRAFAWPGVEKDRSSGTFRRIRS